MAELHSPNFGFLREYDEDLVVLAARAERYVFDDPNTSLLKIRQFAELLASHTAARQGTDPTGMKLQDLIALLARRRVVPREMRVLFDLLRLSGNEAAHERKGDRSEALRSLVTAFELAQWFHNSFGGDSQFARLPFRPPPNPQKAEIELRQELAQLRETAASQLNELSQSEEVLDDLTARAEEYAYESQSLYAALSEMESELAAAEERHDAEKQQIEQKLQALAATAQKRPPAALQSFISRSRQAAYRLRLSEPEAEHLPLTRLRLEGNERCYVHKTPLLLVQSMTGGFVRQNCPVAGCQQGKGLTRAGFESLKVWVSCPNCREKMTNSMVGKNYGFRCPKCPYCCELVSLLPHYSEL